ncbi:hypothetical protein SLG_16060 [Sphingobium sp. SYK-6]|nr:hypothetical protein SLG_16060 [Sphingobium sp. SYK-6]
MLDGHRGAVIQPSRLSWLLPSAWAIGLATAARISPSSLAALIGLGADENPTMGARPAS